MEINLTNNGGGRSRGGSSSSQASSFGGSRGGNGGGFNGRRNRTQRGTFLNFNKQQARSPKDPFAKYVKRAEAIKDAVAYVPVNKFSDFNVSPKLRRAIEVRGFIDPTPIQDQSIPAGGESKFCRRADHFRHRRNPCIRNSYRNHGHK